MKKIMSGLKAHKILTGIIVVTCVIGAYGIYRSAATANAEPQYVLAMARLGTLTQTVTGSGQVSSSNQTDIQSQVSGTIQSINVSVGQSVTTGQLIATIDSTNAAISLQNAKIALAKLTEPVKATDLSNAQNSVNQSYNSAFDSAANIYLDLPAIISGMKDLFYGQTGFLSDQSSSYLSSMARTYRDTAGAEYDKAVNQYQTSLQEFKGLTRTSATSSQDAMLTDTYTTIKEVSQAVTDAGNAVTFITTTQPDYQTKNAISTATSVNTWASQANSDLSNLSSSENSINTSKNSLTNLLAGTDSLDIQSAQLSLQQAQRTYDNYFVRAPYDGIIGRIPVNVYGQAGASTVIATIVGNQKIASISLNEVDAAKVKSGQSVNITFDAIDGLNATGTVSSVDQVGTVTQGVVSYGVKMLINTQDSRIKPGMSVNTTIITNQENGVLIVPSGAIKTQGTKSYVQTFDQTVIDAQLAKARAAAGMIASTSTRQFGSRTVSTSSTPQFNGTSTTTAPYSGQAFASSSRPFYGTSVSQASAQRTITISSATAPVQTQVTVENSDDTNTVILTGLKPGQFVVTKTIAASAAQTTAAPSILSSFGGRGGATSSAGGGARTGSAGAAAARPAGN